MKKILALICIILWLIILHGSLLVCCHYNTIPYCMALPTSVQSMVSQAGALEQGLKQIYASLIPWLICFYFWRRMVKKADQKDKLSAAQQQAIIAALAESKNH